MKIAVTFEDGQVFQHFGHTERFKVYEVENGEIVNTATVETLGSGHGALAGFLKTLNADVLICGGIGGGAISALADTGIKLCAGVSGEADKAVENYLAGKLESVTDATCEHHEGHHGEGCGCAEHHGEHHHGEGCGCGNHSH